MGDALSDVGREDRLGLLYITMLSLVLYLLAVRCYHLFYRTHIMDVVVDIAWRIACFLLPLFISVVLYMRRLKYICRGWHSKGEDMKTASEPDAMQICHGPIWYGWRMDASRRVQARAANLPFSSTPGSAA